MTESSLDNVLAALTSSRDRLSSTLQSLTNEQVAGPSYDDEWSIGQVASHLGSQSEIFELLLAAGSNGTPPPGGEQYQAIWDRWDAKSPVEQAGDAVAADAALLDRINAMDDEARTSWSLEVFGAERDLGGLLAIRLSEHAIHLWDIAVAGDSSATVASDAVELILSQLSGLVQRAGKPVESPTSVRVELSSPDPAQRLDLTADGPSLAEASDDSQADATLRLPAEAFVRLVYGRLDSDHTPVSVQVDGIDLDQLRAVFPGF